MVHYDTSFGLNFERDINRVIIDRAVHPEDSSFRLGLAYVALASHHFDEEWGSRKDLKLISKRRLAVHLIDATEFDSDLVAPALAKATSCIKRSLPNASIARTNISSQDTTGCWEARFVEAVGNASSDKIIVVVPSRLLWRAQEMCLNTNSGLADKRVEFATCDTYANDQGQVNASYLEFTIGKAQEVYAKNCHANEWIVEPPLRLVGASEEMYAKRPTTRRVEIMYSYRICT